MGGESSMKNKKIFYVFFLLISQSLLALDGEQLGVLTSAVTEMCETPTKTGEKFSVEGTAEGGVIVKLLKIGVEGKISKSEWKGIEQYRESQPDRVECVVKLVSILIPTFEKPVPEKTKHTDALKGFYVRDGLANSPVMKITSLGGNEYKLEVFNHPWPWEASVRLSGSDLTGYGRFPKSKATMDFKGRVSGDGSIHSEYHFITKGDGTPARGRVDTHIWILRTD